LHLIAADTVSSFGQTMKANENSHTLQQIGQHTGSPLPFRDPDPREMPKPHRKSTGEAFGFGLFMVWENA